jgi:hypothetical protein
MINKHKEVGSDGHKGFCLEFDKEIREAWKFCRSVDYDKEYLSLKNYFGIIVSEKIPFNDLLRRKLKCLATNSKESLSNSLICWQEISRNI